MHPLLRFTLDLFESNQPLAVVDSAQHAIKVIAPDVKPVAGRRAEPVVTATYRHPRANREARLCDAVVAFEFKRGKRRTIGFSVGPDGLVVCAPKWVPLVEVDAALQEKSHWIIRKLGETREQHARLAAQCIEWRDGTTILFLGEPVTVVLKAQPAGGAAGAELKAAADVGPDLQRTHAPGSTLHLDLAHGATPEQIRDAVQTWLMRQAKRLFVERLDHFAPLLKVQWRKLSLSNASTRWGSARVDGAIRLNWRLMHFRQPIIDYVVVHELSHLRVMDHSPRFWDTVRSVVPDYAALRRQLKDDAVPPWL